MNVCGAQCAICFLQCTLDEGHGGLGGYVSHEIEHDAELHRRAPVQSVNVTGVDALDNLPVPRNDRRPRVSVATCFVRVGQVLMVRHKERGWEFPVGKVEPEELLTVAAARELREETGYEIEPHFFKFVGLFQLRGRSFGHWLNHMFVVDGNVAPWITHKIVDDALDGLKWISWDILDRALCAQTHDASALLEGVPGFAISKTAHMIVNNARRSRDLRDPGYATHCACCLGMIPCRCMRGG